MALDLERELERSVAVALGTLARIVETPSQQVAFLLGSRTCRFLDAFAAPRMLAAFARDMLGSLDLLDLTRELILIGSEQLELAVQIVAARAESVPPCLRFGVASVSPIQLLLALRPLLLGDLGRRARVAVAAFEQLQLLLLAILRLSLGAQFLLASDHTRVQVLIAADAEPAAADPHAIARDDRFPRRQRMALRERFAQRLRRVHAWREIVDVAGRLD